MQVADYTGNAFAIERATATLTSEAATDPSPTPAVDTPTSRRLVIAAGLLAGQAGLSDAWMEYRTMTTQMLKSNQLVLRPFDPDDWDVLNAMLSDAEAMEQMHFKSWDVGQRREWFDACVELGKQPNPDGIGWAIAVKDTGEVIGWFGIGTSSDPTADYDNSFGYALARHHWNQGYMTEALRAVFAYEFETLGVPQLGANCRAPNVASARAMEKAGMRRVKSDYGAEFEGNWSHRHHYIITRAEYESQK